MLYGQAGYIYYFAYDSTTGLGQTADQANHTLRLQKDGGALAAPTNSPTQVDATYARGWYKLLLTAAETAAQKVLLGGTSATSNVLIDVTIEAVEPVITFDDASFGWDAADTPGVPSTVMARLRRFIDGLFFARSCNRATRVETQYQDDTTAVPLHKMVPSTIGSPVVTDDIIKATDP